MADGACVLADNPTQTVALVTLPDALRADERPVHIVKCDVEGGEIGVLRGAFDLLRLDQPLLILEAEMPGEPPDRPPIKAYADFLALLGYRPLLFDYDGELGVGQLGDFTPGHANVLFSRARGMTAWRPASTKRRQRAGDGLHEAIEKGHGLLPVIRAVREADAGAGEDQQTADRPGRWVTPSGAL